MYNIISLILSFSGLAISLINTSLLPRLILKTDNKIFRLYFVASVISSVAVFFSFKISLSPYECSKLSSPLFILNCILILIMSAVFCDILKGLKKSSESSESVTNYSEDE